MTEHHTFPAGWRVFPCEPNSKKPVSGFTDWPTRATDDLIQIAAWAVEYPGCNWAVAAGPSGLCQIDTDPPHGEDVLLELQLEHGFIATRTHKTPRGGRHYFFTGDIPNSVQKLGPKVDTRGRNGYVLIPPSVIDGVPYTVVDDQPIAPLPAWVPTVLAARDREHAHAAEDVRLDTPIAVSRAKTLLKQYVADGYVAVQGSGGDNLTYAVCAEVLNLGVSPEIAAELLVPWNAACVPPWDADDIASKLANAGEYSQNDAGAWAVPPVEQRIDREALDKLIADNDAAPAPREGGARFDWMDEDSFTVMPPPVWLIKDVFTTESIAMLYGPSGHYKSFLALNLAAAVAQQGKCAFYVAAEGISRMARQDYPAWKAAYAEEKRLPFFMQEEMPLAAEPQDFTEFADSIAAAAQAEGKPVGIIFLDTLNTALIGLEENSSGDTAKLIVAMKFLKKQFKCCVVAIHHTPKDGGEPRGSGALYAGMDTVLKVIAEKNVKLARMHVTKQKTAEERDYPFCYEGRVYGGGLAFTPIEPKAAALLSDEGNIFAAKHIRKVLAANNAFEPSRMTTRALLQSLVPQLQNETDEDRASNLERAEKGLRGVIKSKKLDGFHKGFGRNLVWSLPAAGQDEEE